MFEQLLKAYPDFYEHIKEHGHLWKEQVVPRRTILLREGKISNTLYFIVEGSTRVYSVSDGKEINVQFFFENSFVASIESYFKISPAHF